MLIDERATPPPGESDDDEAGPELPDGLAAALRETAQRVAAIADEQTQQERMANCNKDAGSKALKGDERKKFMSNCLKG